MIIRPEKWICKPDDDGNGLLKAQMGDGDVEFPVLVETHNVSPDDVRMDEKQNFEFILECAEKPAVYADDMAYSKGKIRSIDSEAIIPVGLLPAPGDGKLIQTPRVILNGRVVKTYENPAQLGFEESDVLYTLSCLGNEYDAVMHSGFSDSLIINEGNIVSCVYRVQGWPEQNDNGDK